MSPALWNGNASRFLFVISLNPEILVSLHREEEWTAERNYITSLRYSQQQFSSSILILYFIVLDFSVKPDSDTCSFSTCYFC